MYSGNEKSAYQKSNPRSMRRHSARSKFSVPRENKASLHRRMLSEEMQLKLVKEKMSKKENNFELIQHNNGVKSNQHSKIKNNSVISKSSDWDNVTKYSDISFKSQLESKTMIGVRLSTNKYVDPHETPLSALSKCNESLSLAIDAHRQQIDQLKRTLEHSEIDFKVMHRRLCTGVDSKVTVKASRVQSLKEEIDNNENQSKLDLEFERGRNSVKLEKMNQIKQLQHQINEKQLDIERVAFEFTNREIIFEKSFPDDFHINTIKRIKHALYGYTTCNEKDRSKKFLQEMITLMNFSPTELREITHSIAGYTIN